MPITRPITSAITRSLSSAVTEGGGGPLWRGMYRTSPLGNPVLPFGSASINEAIAAGTTSRTLSVDSGTTFAGNATTKLAIVGAGSNTTVEVGVTTASISLNADAQAMLSRHKFVAIKTDGANTISSLTLYVGDGSYANFHTFILGTSDVTSDGWTVYESDKIVAASTTGTPNLSSPVRSKLRLNLSANTAAGNIWIAFCGVLPAPTPTVVFTCDDGYSEWTWLKDQAKARGVPITFGVSTALLNTGGYLTDSQVQAIANDSSGLFEIANHSHQHSNFSTLGLAAYVAQVEQARTYITSTLGLDPYAAALHMYVNGEYDQTLIDQLKVLGYKSARQVGGYNNAAHNLLCGNGTKSSMHRIFAVCNLENTQNLTTVKQYITDAATSGSAFIMGHKFAAAAASETWINGYDANYGVLDLLDWLASKRDTAGWRLMRWSDWTRTVAAGRQSFTG